jgi:hypothetical protein
MAAARAAFDVIPGCRESGSTRLVQCVAINITFLCAIFKAGAGNVLQRLTNTHHI